MNRLGSFFLEIKQRSRYEPYRVSMHPDTTILGVSGIGGILTVALMFPEPKFRDDVVATDIALVTRYFVIKFDGDHVYPEEEYVGSAALNNGSAVHIFEVR